MKINGAVPYDDVAAELYKDDPQLAADMLNSFLADGDMDEFLIGLRQVCKAFGGISEVARATGLHEKTLYKTLSKSGNPNLKTLIGVAQAMGMRVALVPASPTTAQTGTHVQ